MPNVHLAVPGCEHPCASSAAGWSSTSPPTAIGSPNAVVVPTLSSQATIRGIGSSSSPNSASRPRSQSTRSMSNSSDRLAVDASVTNSPQSWCTSQLSVVVTTPSVVTWRRSQVIFGAEKYGSSTSPVRAATISALVAQSGADTSRAAVLPDDRRRQRPPAVAIPRQHGLALVGQRDQPDWTSGLGQRRFTGREHRLKQRVRVLLDTAVGQVAGDSATSAAAMTPSMGSTTTAFVPDVP